MFKEYLKWKVQRLKSNSKDGLKSFFSELKKIKTYYYLFFTLFAFSVMAELSFHINLTIQVFYAFIIFVGLSIYLDYRSGRWKYEKKQYYKKLGQKFYDEHEKEIDTIKEQKVFEDDSRNKEHSSG